MSSARRASTASRRLRALVARLHGCLADLSPGPARLLALRAGLLGRPALSAAGTARALGVTVSDEGRLERRAVTALRGAASNGCGASGAAPGTAAGSTVSAALAAGVTNELSARPAGASLPAGTGTPGSAHAAARHGLTRSAGSGAPGHAAPTTTERANSPAGTPSWALITALAALALAGGFALLRAYRGPAQPAAPAAVLRRAAVVAPGPARTSPAAASRPVSTASPAASAQAPAPSARPTAHTPSAPLAATTPVLSAWAAAREPGEPRRWGRHEVEVAAVTLTAVAGGAARLVSLARRRSARRR